MRYAPLACLALLGLPLWGSAIYVCDDACQQALGGNAANALIPSLPGNTIEVVADNGQAMGTFLFQNVSPVPPPAVREMLSPRWCVVKWESITWDCINYLAPSAASELSNAIIQFGVDPPGDVQATATPEPATWLTAFPCILLLIHRSYARQRKRASRCASLTKRTS